MSIVFTKLLGKWQNLLSDAKFSEILTGSAWALSARLISALFGLGSSIIIARIYGPDILGILALIISFLLLSTIFTVLGTNTSILRLIPEHFTKYSPSSAFKVYRKTQYMIICVSFIAGFILFYFSELIADKVFSKPNLSFYLGLAACFLVFKSMILLNTQAVRGLNLTRIFALMLILPQTINFLLLVGLTFIFTNKDIPVYALLSSYAMTALTGWIIMERAFKKRIRMNDIIHQVGWKELLSISLPMLMTGTMVFVIGQTGVIMLSALRNEAEVGYYAIAVKLSTLVSYIFSAINSVLAPKFSKLFHSDKIDELFYLTRKSAKLIFWTTIPILIGLFISGRQVLQLLYGYKFEIAYPAMLLLIAGQVVNSISGITGNFMNMTGHQKILSNVIFGAGMVNVFFSYLLIPNFGMIGAAFSTAFSISLWNVLTLLFIKNVYGVSVGYLPVISRKFDNCRK